MPNHSMHIKGFTLIEILVALVIISVGVLSLGSFSISTLSSGQVSRERLTAVHLAEQILEEWQKTGVLPTLDSSNYCQGIAPWIVTTPKTVAPCPTTKTMTVSTASCTPLFGVKANYTIVVKESPLCGPSSIANDPFVFYNGSALVPNPKTKVIIINWSHRGKPRSVFLTHISQAK